jgi:hypothetical protein
VRQVLAVRLRQLATSRRVASGLGAVGLVLISIAFSLLVGEWAIRALDGYRLFTWKLTARNPGSGSTTAQRADTTGSHLSGIPLAPGMQADWFRLSPAVAAGTRSADPILERAMVARGRGVDSYRIYNRQFLRGKLCRDVPFRDSSGFVFAFDAPDAAAHPAYRFPRDAVTPEGLTTNRFGWRGPQIELTRRPRTIRVAFVGASTTVNPHSYPFSYPELAAFWLNLWAAALAMDVRIEAINAGREGVGSADIAAIVRDELLPLRPDLVVYYEGANQFQLWDVARLNQSFLNRESLIIPLRGIQKESAIALRLIEGIQLVGRSSTDRDYELVWPEGVDETDPPLRHPFLPANLSGVLRDLEDMEMRLRLVEGELVLSSFFWLVSDAVQLDRSRDKTIIDYVRTHHFPFGYRDIERMADFQNRVFRKFAAARGLPFVDMAAHMPRDPNLFSDPIHATYDGVRLHAWIAAQQLAPLIARRVMEGRLPRLVQAQPAVHPAFPGNERTLTFQCPPLAAGGSARPSVEEFGKGLTIPPAGR